MAATLWGQLQIGSSHRSRLSKIACYPPPKALVLERAGLRLGQFIVENQMKVNRCYLNSILFCLLCLMALINGCSSDTVSDNEKVTSTAYLMDPKLNDASEVFWDSAGFIDTYEGTTDLSPTTEAGWQRVVEAADEITRLSAVLQEEQYSLNRPAWNVFAKSLVTASDRGRRAAENRDSAELFEAGAQLYQVCVACHQAFWSNNRFTVEAEQAQ